MKWIMQLLPVISEKKGNEMSSVVCQFKSTFGHSGHYYLYWGHYYILDQFNSPETDKTNILNCKRLRECVKKSSYACFIG